MACGALLVRRRSISLGVYTALLDTMAFWSLWEVGFDRWASIPRGALLAAIGLWLLAPWTDRSLGEAGAVQVPARCTGQRGWMHRHGTVRDQMTSVLPIPFPMGVTSKWWLLRRSAMARSEPLWAIRSLPTS